ncbi:VanW family protein [Bacillus massiliigorillae]|uniref:VanW family protein n=1 Tax=Bacillus massiliigorillae TaxID=1243664 RepID=UPI0005AA9518|nr:VanW family protein [Bacillus massiliigorillae]
MKVSNFLKLFLTLLFSTAYIFCFTYFGTKAYEQYSGKESLYAKGTEVVGTNIAGKSKKQVENIIVKSIESWQKNVSVTFTYKEKSYAVPNQIFEFDSHTTLRDIQSGKENKAVVTISEDSLREHLLSTSLSIDTDNINMNKLKTDLLAHAESLEVGQYTYSLEQYRTNGIDDTVAISKATVTSLKVNKELSDFVTKLPTIELKEKAVFSLQDYLADSGHNSYTDETLSMIATAIYNAILPTNFTIVERSISEQLPYYARLGYEAKVSTKSNKDLVVLNENNTPYTLEFTYKGNSLSAVLRGNSFLYKYQIKEEKEQSFAPKTIIQFNPKLTTGQIVIKEEGKRGQLIQIYRETYDESGLRIHKELVSEDFYAPIPKIEVHSLLVPPVTKEEEPVTEDKGQEGEKSKDTDEKDKENQNTDNKNDDKQEKPNQDQTDENKDKQPNKDN